MSKYPKIVELRLRAAWVPGGDFRMELGRPTSAREASRLIESREFLRRLALRGDFDTLEAVKGGTLPLELVTAAVDRYGIDNYRAHVRVTPPEESRARKVPTLERHVKAWLEDCDANADLRGSTVSQYEKCLDRLCAFEVDGETLGKRPWHMVPRHTVRDARASLDLAPNTIRMYLGAWSSFFQWALEREESEAEHERREPLIQANPVRKAKAWGRIETTRQRFLAREEFAGLLEVTIPPMVAQYSTLVLGGFRIEEFMTLPPPHMLLDREVIHVGKWGDWQPKVQRSTRDVPIHPDLLPLLEEYSAEWAGSEVSFFVNPSTGHPWQRSAFVRRMRQDIEAAGMRFGAWSRSSGKLVRYPEGVTAHTFRHTFGSWLAMEGVQLLTIAELMGDTYETAKNHYIHLLPGTLKDAVGQLKPGPLLRVKSDEKVRGIDREKTGGGGNGQR